MNRRRRSPIPSQFILTILIIVCVILLFASYSFHFTGGPLQTASNYIFVPMQRGIDYIGSAVSAGSEDAKTRKQLTKENKQLKEQVNQLQQQVSTMQLEQSELEDLQQLYKLNQTYSDYPTVGAHVIARGSSNWFNTFTIDKGSKDGIKRNMNVIAGEGLCGIVRSVGPDYAVVQSIIDDTANVSAMVSSSGDHCIVSGSLEDMTKDNQIEITSLEDPSREVNKGEAVVTSNISSRYLPGILIGYITDLSNDPNDLTRSGTITPVVDFKHLQDVLVITELKKTGNS